MIGYVNAKYENNDWIVESWSEELQEDYYKRVGRPGRPAAAEPTEYRDTVIYTTLSPCDMCSGAILLYGIPKVVIGENTTFRGPEEYLVARGVQLEVLDDADCKRLMREFITANPELWNEDIGI